jgi:hypothetical protein
MGICKVVSTGLKQGTVMHNLPPAAADFYPKPPTMLFIRVE